MKGKKEKPKATAYYLPMLFSLIVEYRMERLKEKLNNNLTHDLDKAE